MAGSIQSRAKCLARLLAGAFACAALFAQSAIGQDLQPYVIDGDAIGSSLTGAPGDASKGKTIVQDRQVGLCLLCHSGPFPNPRFQGNLAPSLAGAGARWGEGQLRMRIVDARRLNPDTIMPPYYRTEGLVGVDKPHAGKTILDAGQIEDVVAFLVTLKDQGSQ